MLKTRTIDARRQDFAAKAQRRIIVEAIILALLVHALLLLLFDYAPADLETTATPSPGVAFMSMAGLEPAKQRELRNWLEYHEPSMISAPHGKHGYNRLNPQEIFRPALPDRKFSHVLPEIPPGKPESFKDLKPSSKPAPELHRNYIFHPLYQPPPLANSRPASDRAALEAPSYPLITANGCKVSIDLDKSLQAEAARLNAKDMRIEYQPGYGELFPRVIVMKSSGNRNFDVDILQNLSQPLASTLKQRKNLTIEIKWKKRNAETADSTLRIKPQPKPKPEKSPQPGAPASPQKQAQGVNDDQA